MKSQEKTDTAKKARNFAFKRRFPAPLLDTFIKVKTPQNEFSVFVNPKSA
jgi:hypothetical protein